MKIVGKVRILGTPLVAPLTERPCAFFDAVAENYAGVVIARETFGHDFLVEDDTGLALVRVKSAQVVVKLDACYESDTTQATSRQWALLTRHIRPQRGRVRYREGTLTPGEIVAVVGTPYLEAHPNPDPRTSGQFREMAMRLVFDSDDRDTVQITDDL